MSINRITFFHDIIPQDICIFSVYKFEIPYQYDWIQWAVFIDKLDKDELYVVTLELVVSWNSYDSDGPIINLSKPIVLNCNSNPHIIGKFVNDKVIEACLIYNLNENFSNKSNMLDKNDIPGVIVKYAPIALEVLN